MGWKDMLMGAVGKGSKATQRAVCEVAPSDFRREPPPEVLRAETAHELAKAAVCATGDRLTGDARKGAVPILAPWEERLRARSEAWEQRGRAAGEARAVQVQQEARERREREIGEEIEAIRKQLGRS